MADKPITHYGLGSNDRGSALSIKGEDCALMGNSDSHPVMRILKADNAETLRPDFGNFCLMDGNAAMYNGAVTETATPFVFNSGSDAQAVDPVVATVASKGNVWQCVSGDAGTGVAADGSQLVAAAPLNASRGGLFFRADVSIVSAVTNAQVFVGFTDSKSLELPASISGTTVTTNMSDGFGFAYDTGATTDQWYAVGVDTNTDATGQAITGEAPTADTFQTLYAECDADGANARFYIDGSLVATFTANACTPTVDLYFTCIVNATTTTSKTVNCFRPMWGAEEIWASHVK